MLLPYFFMMKNHSIMENTSTSILQTIEKHENKLTEKEVYVLITNWFSLRNGSPFNFQFFLLYMKYNN